MPARPDWKPIWMRGACGLKVPVECWCKNASSAHPVHIALHFEIASHRLGKGPTEPLSSSLSAMPGRSRSGYARPSTQAEFWAGPVGEAVDRSIPFRRGAGEKLEHVLHLRHDLERHINAGLARELGQIAA